MLVTSRALRARRDDPALWADGEYVPLRATGAHAEHVVAFARRHEGREAIAVVPRLTTRLGDGWPLGDTWADAALPLTGEWRNVLTDDHAEDASLATILRALPVAILTRP
jgi:(1->4)-alpha-D-glucan 1-alpha-D-glucosylmutase